MQRCRARLNHLDALTLDSQAEWNSNRLRRVLVDYMLRMSYYETAEKLADISGLQVRNFAPRLVNIGFYEVDY